MAVSSVGLTVPVSSCKCGYLCNSADSIVSHTTTPALVPSRERLVSTLVPGIIGKPVEYGAL